MERKSNSAPEWDSKVHTKTPTRIAAVLSLFLLLDASEAEARRHHRHSGFTCPAGEVLVVHRHRCIAARPDPAPQRRRRVALSKPELPPAQDDPVPPPSRGACLAYPYARDELPSSTPRGPTYEPPFIIRGSVMMHAPLFLK
jgi:hypothetical protein